MKAKLDRVNHECLSITEANMRADVLADLYGRVGAGNFWTRLAEQALLKTHFQDLDTASVEGKAKRKLNDLMDLRNRIAHPSGAFEWPSVDTLRDYVLFLRLLARAMADLVAVLEVALCVGDPGVAPAAGASTAAA